MIFALSSIGYSRTYYVSPNGNDTNTGSKEEPFLSLGKAQNILSAGDTVYVRGGTFLITEKQINNYSDIWASVIELSKSGKKNKRINYWAYPNEKPIFDFSAIKPSNYRIKAFNITGSWIHIKGIAVVGVQVTILTHTQSECFSNEGSDNIFEQLSMHDGQAIGFFLRSGSNNLILNCDAYHNHDYTSENGKGGNTDGFGNHPSAGSVNNVFRGCRAWFNSDDGFDCINASEATVFENCWAFCNGYSPDFKSLGDGNGFKAGGYAYRPPSKTPNPIPRNLIRFCLAANNKANGFYANHHREGNDWYNNTAYKNSVNYNMLNRLADNSNDVPGFNHNMKNNLGFAARRAEISNIDSTQSDIKNNYFSLSIAISADDFISVDFTELSAPRKPDGSLPEVNCMRPKSTCKWIHAVETTNSTSVIGIRPFLGCFEPK